MATCTICRAGNPKHTQLPRPCTSGHALCVQCAQDVMEHYECEEPVCPRCVSPDRAPPAASMGLLPPSPQGRPYSADMAELGTPYSAMMGGQDWSLRDTSPVKLRKELERREHREGSVLVHRFRHRGGPPTRAVHHQKAAMRDARSPKMNKTAFSETVTSLPRNCAKPYYLVEDGKPHNRRLLADLRVCSKLQAQKDFMRPGW